MLLHRDWPTSQMIRDMAKRFPDLNPASAEAYLAMLRTAVETVAWLEEIFASHELSTGRFSILMLLFRDANVGDTPASLAERAGVTRATVTGLLDGLEQAGLLARTPHPDDRRRVMVRLTDRGLRFMQDFLPGHFKRLDRLMGRLDDKEKRTLVSLMAKLEAGVADVAEKSIQGDDT